MIVRHCCNNPFSLPPPRPPPILQSQCSAKSPLNNSGTPFPGGCGLSSTCVTKALMNPCKAYPDPFQCNSQSACECLPLALCYSALSLSPCASLYCLHPTLALPRVPRPYGP